MWKVPKNQLGYKYGFLFFDRMNRMYGIKARIFLIKRGLIFTCFYKEYPVNLCSSRQKF